MEAFDLLPFACLINSCYFCAHGGISDKLLNVSNLLFRLVKSMQLIELGKFLMTDLSAISFGQTQSQNRKKASIKRLSSIMSECALSFLDRSLPTNFKK